ncbi:PAS domain S-box protein [Catalinimonas niigatensis]|uniref:PAS domain S-box protein n=1 Tax=Catalinimonas niigatensis TaxID=1397264 RepID=UPI002665CA81|nr:PAS domain S-box protein [Catalinimonas niigatensis]WPP51636.1 PAS domain S-box protein [Catalinimonas niigatensis]
MSNYPSDYSYDMLHQFSKEQLMNIILSQDNKRIDVPGGEASLIYQKIFDESPDALMLIHSESQQIVMCNARAVKMFGLNEKDELLGGYEYLFHKESSTKNSPKQLEEDKVEVEYIGKKKSAFWGLKETQQIKVGQNQYWLITITDITAKKEAEQALALERARLKMLIEHTDDLVWSIDKNLCVTEFNREAYKVANSFAGIHLKLNHSVFSSGKNPETQKEITWKKYFSRVLSGEKFTVQYVFSKEYQDCYYEFHFHPIYHNGQEIVGATIFGRDISERKQQEEKLKYTENLYKSVVNTQHEMICRFQPDTTISFVNHACVRHLGKPTDRLIGKKFLELIPVKEHQQFVKGLRKIAKEGKPSTNKYIVESPEGKRYWHHWTIIPVYNHEGILAEFQAAGLDITSKMMAEQKMRASEEKFRTLVLAAPVGIFLTNKQGYCTWTNKKLQEIGDFRFEEALGDGIFQSLHHEDKELILKLWKKSKQNEALFHERMECRYLLKSGEVKWIFVTFTPLMSEDQRVIGFVGIVEDVTDRKQSEILLKEREVKYKYLFENNPNPLILLDAVTNVILDVNEAAIQKYGYTRAGFIGLHLHHLQHKDDINEYLSHRKHVKMEPLSNIFHAVCRHKTKEGKIIYVNIHAHVYEQDGSKKELILINDITKRKEYEDELIGTKSELEKALQIKDEFLSVMSHEIRTPLNAIIGLSHLLKQQDHLSAQEETLQTIGFSADHLLTLVNDILDFSKLQAGKLKLEDIAYNLHELARQTIKLFQIHARDKQIDLILEIDEQLPAQIMGDPTRISQILNNLLSNAVKFTDKGSITLNLSKKSINQLRIKVKDSGIGMTKEEQSQIFEAFTQANSSTSRKYGGTGLGLTITKKLVNLQGGDLRLKSKPGAGTTFIIDLPLTRAAPALCTGKKVNISEEKLKGLHILYVEDVLPNQFLMKGFCSHWGVHLDIASDGEEAMEILKTSQQYDLILMDIMMPGMDGYETSQQIRKVQGPYYKTVPIIAVTASVSNKEVKKYLQYGMSDFIEKPIKPQELIQKIISSLSPQQASPSTGEDHAQKNMFTLLEEYHAQNPKEYVTLLETSQNYIHYYRELLLDALKKNRIEDYVQQSHKLINLLMHFKQDAFIELLRKSTTRINRKGSYLSLKRELDEAFEKTFSHIRSQVLKSKNLLK